MYNQEIMKIVATNRRARFDYDITDTYVTGVVLNGPEVKSAKAGQINLKGSYVMLRHGEAYLTNAHIAPYQHAETDEAEASRDRKLLLHKKEITKLAAHKQNGRTIVPLAAGIERGLVKIKIGVGRGRRKYDKREHIRRREARREIKKAAK